MSRAFVKENDLECAGIDIPDRPLSDALNYATPNGLKLLKETIDSLEKERENLKKKEITPLQNKNLVPTAGIELATSSLPWKCSTN